MASQVIQVLIEMLKKKKEELDNHEKEIVRIARLNAGKMYIDFVIENPHLMEKSKDLKQDIEIIIREIGLRQ